MYANVAGLRSCNGVHCALACETEFTKQMSFSPPFGLGSMIWLTYQSDVFFSLPLLLLLVHPFSPNVATAVGTATTQALPEPLAELVMASSSCMSATAISDLTTPRIVFSRVALLGDTATLLRPHAGMSTASQAAAAAVSLADALVEKRFAVEKALAAWQEAVHPQQLALSRQSSLAGDRLQGFEQ
jgi:hypothetical protein